MHRIVKPMPTAAEHAPLSILNRSELGIRTTIICSCEWMPAAAPESASRMNDAHAAHRKKTGLPPADYSRVVFGEGPWMGLTWDEWYSQHGGQDIDPFTGTRRTHGARREHDPAGRRSPSRAPDEVGRSPALRRPWSARPGPSAENPRRLT